MDASKTLSRGFVLAGGVALLLFAVGGVLAQTRAGATAQRLDAGSAQSREVSAASASGAVERQGLEHRLVLYNTHTAERIDIVYRRGEEYVPAALAKLDYFLRDHVTGDVRHFDPRLYDILADLRLRWDVRAARLTSFADTARRRRMNLCARTRLALRSTACTYRRKRLTCGCLGSTP